MAENNFFSHGNGVNLVIGLGGFTIAGENIAAGYNTGSEVGSAWMNSPGHRAIMLDGRFSLGGVGVWCNPNSSYKTYFTMEFAGH